MPNLGNRVIFNFIYGALRFICSVPLLFIITPLMIHTLGIECYGVWSLLSVIAVYTQFCEFGMTKALTKHVADFSAQGNTEGINQILNTALALYGLLGGTGLVLILALNKVLATVLFKFPPELMKEGAFVLNIIAVVFFLNVLAGFFGSILGGLQRLDISNKLLIIYQLADAALTAFVLISGYGLRGLALSKLMSAILLFSCNLWAITRVVHHFHFNLHLFERTMVKGLVLYGLNVQIGSVVAILADAGVKLLIRHMVSVAAVSALEIASRLLNQIRGVFLAGLASILPAAASLNYAQDKERLRMLHHRATRYLVLGLVPIGAIVSVLASPFIRLWLGPELDVVVSTLRLLIWSSIISIIGVPAYEILSGTDQIRVATRISVFTGLLTCTSAAGAGILWGFHGIVSGLAISLVVSSILTLHFCNRLIGVRFRDLLSSMPWKALPGAVLVAILLWSAQNGRTFEGFSGWLLLFVFSITGAMLYVTIVYLSKTFDELDKKLISILINTRLVKTQTGNI